MKKYNVLVKFLFFISFVSSLFLTSCDKDDDDDLPPEENESELITDITLTFSSNDGEVVTALAEDPDGEGIQGLEIKDDIVLSVGKTYSLSIEAINELAEHDDDHGHDHGYDVTEEILEEADDHQVFFGFTEGAFSNPAGDGNIDNPSDPVNYSDQDSNGRPLGLSSSWTAGSGISNGSFRVVLKHQQGMKSVSSGVNVGDTDFDLTFRLIVR